MSLKKLVHNQLNPNPMSFQLHVILHLKYKSLGAVRNNNASFNIFLHFGFVGLFFVVFLNRMPHQEFLGDLLGHQIDL